MTASEPTGQHYDLFTLEGKQRLFRSVVGERITLGSAGLAWVIKGQERRRAYRDIRAIHLQAIPSPQGLLAICRVNFIDGLALQVRNLASPSLSNLSLTSDDRDRRYGQFVEDLHRYLHSMAINTIKFRGGNTSRYHAFFTAALIFAVAFLVVLPIFVAAWISSWEPLKVLAGTAPLALSLVFIWRRRRPVTYTPDQVPPELLP